MEDVSFSNDFKESVIETNNILKKIRIFENFLLHKAKHAQEKYSWC